MTADTTGGGKGLTISVSSGDEDSSEYIMLSRVAIVDRKETLNPGVDKSVDIERVESDNLDRCLDLCV